MNRDQWKAFYRQLRAARDKRKVRVTGFLSHNGFDYLASLGAGFSHDSREPRAGAGLTLTQSIISERPTRARWHSESEWVRLDRAAALGRYARPIDLRAYLRGIEYLRFIRLEVPRLRAAA